MGLTYDGEQQIIFLLEKISEKLTVMSESGIKMIESKDVFEHQRRVIDEYKQIIIEKQEALDHWFQKCQNLSADAAFLRMKLTDLSGESAK